MNMMSWKIGQVEITQIIEIEAGEVIQETIPDALPSAVREINWLVPHFADEAGKLKGVVQAFLVRTESEVVLVDTCVGNDKARVDLSAWNNLQTEFLKVLKEAGCAPEDIDKVVCTHLHFDHVGWNTRRQGNRWVPTFENARYLMLEKEYEYWKSNPENEITDDKNGFIDSVLPVYEAGLVSFVELGESIAENMILFPTPGHTPGHASILVEVEGERAIITGDAMHHPCQIARPHWHTLADTDPDLARRSRKDLLDKYADTGTLFIGSHFAQPTAGWVCRDGDTYRFDTERHGLR